MDSKKIKDLETELKKFKENDGLKMGKFKSEVPNHRRNISDDSDEEEESESITRPTR